MQLCDVHNVVANNETVSIFYDKERKEQFTSFKRFNTYNSNATTPTMSVVLKYNFSIIPAGLDKPQEYVITVRLSSRVALLRHLEAEAPPFIRNHLSVVVAASEETAVITVEYADYIIARGFLEAFDEWIRGCRTESEVAWISFLKRWSHYIPRASRLIVALSVTLFSLQAIPSIFSNVTPELWARCAVLFFGGFAILTGTAGEVGRIIEDGIDGFTVISYLSLNKGDKKLIEEFGKRKSRVRVKFIGACLLNLALSLAASQLAELV